MRVGGLLRAGVRLIDHLLSASLRITPISTDPDCIVRLQIKPASHTVTINNENISKGDPILALHLHNERLPGLPEGGATLAWALTIHRQLVYSFRLVARLLQTDSRLAQVRAIYGVSALLSFSGHTGGMRMMQQLGFTVFPYHRPFGRFGEFWENLFSWWLIWTYNPPSLHRREFWRLQRTEIWISATEFIRRYGISAIS